MQKTFAILFVLVCCVASQVAAAKLNVLTCEPEWAALAREFGGDHLKELMVGQILWVELAALKWVAVLTVFVLTLWFGLHKRLGHIGFYILSALSVTASVQLVGVYMVFATLIIPALASSRFQGKSRLLVAYALGTSGYAAGLIASALLDLPSGAVIVWSLALLSIIMWFVPISHVGEESKI